MKWSNEEISGGFLNKAVPHAVNKFTLYKEEFTNILRKVRIKKTVKTGILESKQLGSFFYRKNMV